MRKIVIIDDNFDIIRSVEDNFSNHSYKFFSFVDARQALLNLESINPEIILLDIVMPKMDGFAFLEKVKLLNINSNIIIISGENKVDYAVKALKLGAVDYVTKPFDFEILDKTITQYLNIKNIRKNKYLRNNIIGKSDAIKEIHTIITKLAKSYDTTILIQGETGTGKELVAQAIHFQSQRQDEAFIEINCSAMQETLLESELFGHEKGAFTGAECVKKGLLEIADKGTFFLDEIGDMPINLQAKLLKVLEQKKFRRIGGLEEIEVNVRFLCATSQNLEEKIKMKKFREDLFYRINVATINLPTLKSRKTDVLILAQYFLNQYNIKFQKKINGFSSEVKNILLKYNWPGNVRELKNVIERAVLFSEDSQIQSDNLTIKLKDNSNSTYFPETIPSGNLSLDQLEKQLIIKALIQTEGHQTKAADLLKISRERLKHRIKKHKIDLSNIKNG